MYFLGLCALELLGNEQEIHDLGGRVGTPQFGELFMGASLLQQELQGKQGVAVPFGWWSVFLRNDQLWTLGTNCRCS